MSKRGTRDRSPAGANLVEVAWEVCNQVGGIYQVLRSKAPSMTARWRNRYCMIGPLLERPPADFEELRPTGWMARVMTELGQRGVDARHGRWLVPGRPRVLLVRRAHSTELLDQLEHELEVTLGFGTPLGDDLVDMALLFGDATRHAVESIHASWAGDSDSRRLVAHFHEWLAGFGMLLTIGGGTDTRTVFTTHATMLGRYAAAHEHAFYDRIGELDSHALASHYGIAGRHSIERICAQRAHVLTTVSAITGEECTHLLGRTPEIITPNGLNIDRFDVGHDFQTLHAEYKDRLHQMVMGHFFPSYSFDLDRTLYFFTSGRYEPQNKGYDLCIEAMARLDTMLKAAKLPVTCVLFIITQREVRSMLPAVLERRAGLNELRGVCSHMAEAIGDGLFRSGAAGERRDPNELVSEYWRLRYLRTLAALRRLDLPPIVTHQLVDEHDDGVLNHLRVLGLHNRPDQRVKVVYHPQFVNPVNPLWGIEYDQFVRGCHLGLFPSAYEPWGYTPLECVAMGVPAITSDLAGFGRTVADEHPDSASWGLSVLARRGREFGEAAQDLADMLLDYCRLDRRGRVALRNDVQDRAYDFDWRNVVAAYHRAHDRALR